MFLWSFVNKGYFAELWVILFGFEKICSLVFVRVHAYVCRKPFLLLLLFCSFCVKGFALSEYVMWSSGRLNIVLLNAAI